MKSVSYVMKTVLFAIEEEEEVVVVEVGGRPFLVVSPKLLRY